jgi:hypothetical protein
MLRGSEHSDPPRGPADAPAIARIYNLGTVGVHRRHGRLDGEWRDVLVVERLLGEAADSRFGPTNASSFATSVRRSTAIWNAFGHVHRNTELPAGGHAGVPRSTSSIAACTPPANARTLFAYAPDGIGLRCSCARVSKHGKAGALKKRCSQERCGFESHPGHCWRDRPPVDPRTG